MVKIKKYKNIIEKIMSGEQGQRFFNAAYSIGAAVVILGALFKILHLTGGNTLLCIGMGTEVLMFILTAFDRPEEQYHWEEVFPQLRGDENAEPITGGGIGGGIGGGGIIGDVSGLSGMSGISGGTATGSGSIIIVTNGGQVALSADDSENLSGATTEYAEQLSDMSKQMQRLRESTEELNTVSAALLESYRVISEASTINAEQMQELSKNIAEFNANYAAQLQGMSAQIDGMQRMAHGFQAISMEPERMAANMRQLNMIYERMLSAMNIYSQPMAFGAQPHFPQQQPNPQNNSQY